MLIDQTTQSSSLPGVYWREMRHRYIIKSLYQQPLVDQSKASYRQPTPPTVHSNAITAAIATCWHLLKKSNLDEATFSRLVSAASDRAVRPSMGLNNLDARSLAVFLHFWDVVRASAERPEVSISPKGNIQAEWTRGGGNILILEFQPSGEIYFSLWQDGYPIEGVKSPTRTHELMKLFDTMDDNPLNWSDAA